MVPIYVRGVCFNEYQYYLIIKENLKEGWGYDEACQVGDVNSITARAQKFGDKFFNLCNHGKEPLQALDEAFGEVAKVALQEVQK